MAQPSSNPFADLIPEPPAPAVSAGGNPFADLLPPTPGRRLTSSGVAQDIIDRSVALQRARELDAIANAKQAQEPLPAPQRVRARGTMADFPTPFQLPPAGPEPEQQQPPRQIVSRPMRVQQVTPAERFAAHAGAAFQNTLAGQAASAYRGGERYARQAEQLDKIIHYAESRGSKVALPLPQELSAPDPLTGVVSPSGSDLNKDAADTLGMPFVGKRLDYLRQLRRDAEASYGPAHAEEVRRQNIRQFQYQTMPGSKSPLDVAAAVGGELAGGLPTPENLVPVGRGATLLRTFAKGAAANGVTNLLADPVVQMAQIRMGTRKQFDPQQTFISAVGGGFLGGALNVSPEVATRIAQVVARATNKSILKVRNSDVYAAMTDWLRNPDTMPPELQDAETVARQSLSPENAQIKLQAAPTPPNPFADLTPTRSMQGGATAVQQRGGLRAAAAPDWEQQMLQKIGGMSHTQLLDRLDALEAQIAPLEAQSKALGGTDSPEKYAITDQLAELHGEHDMILGHMNVEESAGVVPPPQPGSKPVLPVEPYIAHIIPFEKKPQTTVYRGGIMGPPFSKLTPEAAQATAAIPAPEAGNVVVTPRGRRVGVQYEVVDAGTLIPSHTSDMRPNPQFPPELQPRQRERAASQAQIADIASRLEPELLGRSASSAEGAPIVGPDNVVESGNARTLAITRAYDNGMSGAKKYRDWLQTQGFDTTGMQRPVLIRRRITELAGPQRTAFTREANERTTLAMGAAEQAKSDATAMPDWLVTDIYKGGDIGTGVNGPFVRKFADLLVPPSERGAFFSGAGQLSQEGRRRIENALFAKAYGDTRILGNLRESPDVAIKSIGDAMIEAAPAWSRLRADIEAGDVRPEMDITPHLVEAVNLVERARKQGVPVSALVNQSDMLAGAVSEDTKAALGLLFKDRNFTRPASKPALSQALNIYADQARHVQTGPSLDLGGPPTTAADIIAVAKGGGGEDLFGGTAAQRSGGVLASRQPAGSGVQAQMQPGANYVGAAPQRYNPAVPSTGEPIRRETILRNFIEGMGIPVYQRRIKGGRMLGFFRPSIHEVRIKNANDLETTAHEMAHYMDRLIPIIRRQWLPAKKSNAVVRAELAGVSYDKTKLYEGYAEFVRLFLTQDAQARAKAPTFYAWFEQLLNHMAASDDPRHVRQAAAIRQAQRDFHAWFEQSAADRLRSKIGSETGINERLYPTTIAGTLRQSLRQGVSRAIQQMRQTAVDDFAGIRHWEKGLTGEISPTGPYELHRLTRAADSITEGALEFGHPVVKPDGSHIYEGKGLIEILKPVADRIDDWIDYAVARRGHFLRAQGRENLLSPAEIAAGIAKETPEFREAFDRYQVWNHGVLDFAQAKGIIDPVARKQWDSFEYIPFNRVQEGTPTAKEAAGIAPGDWHGIKALTGGTSNLRPILGNIINNARTLITAGLQNEARQELARMAGRSGGAAIMAKIPKDDKRILVMNQEIERTILDALGVGSKQALPVDMQILVDQILNGLEPMTALFTRGNAPKGKAIVAVLHAGKPSYYEVADPLAYRAIAALNRPMRGALMKFLGKVKNVVTTTTTVAPPFLVKNALRDTLATGILSPHDFKWFSDSARGYASRIMRDQHYRDFVANGGGLSANVLDEQGLRKHLERYLTSQGIDYQTVLDTPQKLWFGLKRISEASEQASRIGHYRKAVAAGAPPRHAAYAAREGGSDFAMRGDRATALGQIIGFFADSVPFFNAMGVSIDRFLRGIGTEPGRGEVAIKVGLLAAASGALWAINHNNPLYEQLQPWEKDMYWHIFLPTPATIAAIAEGQPLPPLEDRYYHMRIPKLWEIGAASSIAERQLEGIVKGQPLKAQANSLNIIRQQFNLGLPAAIQPLVEQAMNKDFFTGRPIENQADLDVLPFARADASTSPTLRKVGMLERGLPPELQVSPKAMEHLLQGYFTTWSDLGLGIADWAGSGNRPAMRPEQYPVIGSTLGAFYRTEPAQSTHYVNDLYDAITAATQYRRTMKRQQKTFEPDVAHEIAQTPENLQYKQLTHADKKMQQFRHISQAVADAPDLAAIRKMIQDHATATKDMPFLGKAMKVGNWNSIGNLKRLLLDQLTRERNDYAKTVMDSINRKTGTQ